MKCIVRIPRNHSYNHFFFFFFLAAGRIAVRPFAAADGEQVLPPALGSLNLSVARGQTAISSSTSQGKTLSRPDDLGLLKEAETKKSGVPTRFRCAQTRPHTCRRAGTDADANNSEADS